VTRYIQNLALLAKPETVYGTDSSPTGMANAIQATNCKYDISATEVERDLLKPYMGHQGVILTGKFVTLSFEVEIAGSGAAGTPPNWGALMKMCGFAEVITATTKVVYNPISGSFQAGSIYYNLDGVNHIGLGARGNLKASLQPKQIPRFTFEMKALLGTITDTALPTVDYTGFQAPVPVSKANTTFTLHGYAGATESVSIDLGAGIEDRLLINKESIEYVERKATGQAVMEASTLATINWYQKAFAHQVGAMALVHGTTAGNIVQFDAANVQLGVPSYGDSQKIVNNQLNLKLKPSDAGNDELLITVK
jgi:hypothetical protein